MFTHVLCWSADSIPTGFGQQFLPSHLQLQTIPLNHVHLSKGTRGGQKRAPDPLELELQAAMGVRN